MKTMVVLVISLLLVAAVPAIAQEQELTSPGITPDSWLYGLSRGIERLQLILTWDRTEKAKLHLGFAEKRLAELKAMIERGKPEFVQMLVKDHDAELNETESEVNAEEGIGRDVTALAEHVSNATYRHILVLEDVLERVPDNAKQAIEHAINASSKGHERAMKRIEKRMSERAAALNSEFAEDALKRAGEMIEKGKVEKGRRMLDLYMRKMNDTEEATERVEGLGKDVALSAEHVCNMTYKHVYVLQNVLERVPEQAKPAIEKVINASVRRHENCSERILERMNKTVERIEKFKCTTDSECMERNVSCPSVFKFELKCDIPPNMTEGTCKCRRAEMNCTLDADCREMACPMILGSDTGICRNETCKCGGKWEIVNKTEWRERFKEELTNTIQKRWGRIEIIKGKKS